MLGISRNEFILAFAFLVMGVIASSKEVILFLNGLDPITGFIFYESILYVALFILSRANLVIYKFQLSTPLQTLGALFITTAFFICVNWESCYDQTVISGSCAAVSNIYFGSEDGSFYYMWNTLVGLAPDIAGRMTYWVTPFVLALLGGILTSQKKVKIIG